MAEVFRRHRQLAIEYNRKFFDGSPCLTINQNEWLQTGTMLSVACTEDGKILLILAQILADEEERLLHNGG